MRYTLVFGYYHNETPRHFMPLNTLGEADTIMRGLGFKRLRAARNYLRYYEHDGRAIWARVFKSVTVEEASSWEVLE